MRTAKLTIPGTFPGMNDIISEARKHYRASHKQKRFYTELTGKYAKYSKIPKFPGKVKIHIVFCDPNRRRDRDNIYAGAKFVLDGLVEAGVILDDNQKTLIDLTYGTLPPDKLFPHITVYITDCSQEDPNDKPETK